MQWRVRSRPSDMGGRSSRPWHKGWEGRSYKKTFRPFWPQFGLNIREDPAPRAPPLDPTLSWRIEVNSFLHGFKSYKGLFTWSGGPRSSEVGFFRFHALGDTKQKKPTPLDWGPPLYVNRVLECAMQITTCFLLALIFNFNLNNLQSRSSMETRGLVRNQTTLHVLHTFAVGRHIL